MAATIEEIVAGFRDSARNLRRLADSNVKEIGRVLEIYEHQGEVKTADPFLRYRCLELANQLEALAAMVEAVPPVPRPRRHT